MNKNIDQKDIKMNTKEIFSQYATYYDILYQDKDYGREALFISKLIKKLLPENKENIRVLDIACGTGRHTMELSHLGYKVEGSDLSEEMIKIAVKESKKSNLDIAYYNESFQTIGRIGKRYDVILSMFSAINYLTTYNDFSAALKNIYSLLNDDGIFIFDFWNGNAVIDHFSPVRVKRMAKNAKEILRISETAINQISQLATVRFNFMLLENGRISKEFEEKHLIRYFFLQEMIDLLQANNLEVVFRCPFMNVSEDVSYSDWNVTYVAKKNK